MFREAYKLAREFTRPVILSRKLVSGECSSSIGAFVVINEKGWIVTAAHILDQWEALLKARKASFEWRQQLETIRGDTTLSEKDKRKRVSKLPKLPESATDQCSIWWAFPEQTQILNSLSIPAGDVAVGKLEPFNPAWVKSYPVFKDPTKDFEPGTSLCKVGFPFHSVTPRWLPEQNSFELPPEALPVPFFPLEGIFTRTAELRPSDGKGSPVRFVETSSPGLKGQSGGPTVDVKGTVWAIQSRTYNLPLGFNPKVIGKPGHTEHQFLNVGHGVHPETLFALFKEAGIVFTMSNY